MDYKEELDRVYSLYIRLRDAQDGGWTRCISCGHVYPFEQMQCGHYWSRKHIATRWDEQNCNSECSFCNVHEVNHLVGYRKNLIAKIGEDAFGGLERRHLSESKEPEEWEYKELIRGYKELCRVLKKAKGIPVAI